MTPEKIHTDAFRVVGPGGEFSHEDSAGIPALWEDFGRRAGEISNPDPSHPFSAFGAMFGAPEKFLYVAGLPSLSGAVPEGMRELEVPAGNYAKFVHEAKGADGLPEAMKSLFRRVFGEWLPAAGLSFRPGPVLERYGEKFDPKTMTGKVEIWVPVE